MADLSIILISANLVPEKFLNEVCLRLQDIFLDLDIDRISVTHKWLQFGKNIVVDLPRHHLSIYRQALIGAKEAETKYIAIAEDDVLYSPEHFKYRPSPGKFAYNMNAWNIYTWTEPIFSQKLSGRKNLNGLICERDAFIKTMEERFAKWPNDGEINLGHWGEPGKYEKKLGITPVEFEHFTTNPPNVIFSHETELSFTNLGTRKRLGEIRAYDIPYWGTAKEIRGLYGS